MTDRELLELAAKAAGIEWYGVYSDDDGGLFLDIGPREVIEWNPLNDDGDRHRLARQLDIRIHWGPQYVTCSVGGISQLVRWPEDVKNDVYAIVHAAARIGESLP